LNVAVSIISSFFDNVWRLFTRVDVPGLGVPFSALVVALLIINFSIKVFGLITGYGGVGGSDYGRASTGIKKVKSYYKGTD